MDKRYKRIKIKLIIGGTIKAMRGEITKEIQNIAKQFLGREITTTELRLYPYIDYCLKNCGYYDRNKINGNERDILFNLKQEKHLEMIVGKFYVTQDFYNFISKILWISYVETKIE